LVDLRGPSQIVSLFSAGIVDPPDLSQHSEIKGFHKSHIPVTAEQAGVVLLVELRKVEEAEVVEFRVAHLGDLRTVAEVGDGHLGGFRELVSADKV
jgi:hypothetical protein